MRVSRVAVLATAAAVLLIVALLGLPSTQLRRHLAGEVDAFNSIAPTNVTNATTAGPTTEPKTEPTTKPTTEPKPKPTTEPSTTHTTKETTAPEPAGNTTHTTKKTTPTTPTTPQSELCQQCDFYEETYPNDTCEQIQSVYVG
jgi:outer membrane biosynthesis protein TonB